MSRVVLAGLVLGVHLLTGCGGRDGVRCEDPSRYATSDSIPPVRVPDDLSVPDESGALRIPPGARSDQSVPADACLESPPDFFEDEDVDEAETAAGPAR